MSDINLKDLDSYITGRWGEDSITPDRLDVSVSYVRDDGECKMEYHPDLVWEWYVLRHGAWERDDNLTKCQVITELEYGGYEEVV